MVGRPSYGSATAFMVPPLSLASVRELPDIVAVGVVIGALAAAGSYEGGIFSVVTREQIDAAYRCKPVASLANP
jgi:hypothetical protein